MNNNFKLIFLLFFLILGCNSKLTERVNILQKIENLDMNIYSQDGNKIYTIKSPNSIYDQKNNIFILKKTTIYLFKDQKVKFVINSDSSKLSKNNKILELNGNVELNTFQENNDILYADNFEWNIETSQYLLNGNVNFENKDIILISNKAIMNSNNLIEFFNPVKYIIKNDDDKKKYEINSENAFYNIDTKSVNFSSKDDKVRSTIYF